MSAIAILKYTAEDYLKMEATSLEKHEFYHGEIFAMAGASITHNQVTSNTHIAVGNFLSDKGKCNIFQSDLKIHSMVNSLFTYPDLSIVCGKIETLENHNDIVTNPSVLIEVLSASTQDYDRGGKFKLYRDIPSLKEYITISSLEVLVEKWDKQDNGAWLLNTYTNIEDRFAINTIEMEITVNSLYRNVMFETE